MGTPLPPIDAGPVAQFWQRFLATGVVPASTPVPASVEPFGDGVELADELIELVVRGPKRATAGALVDDQSAEYQQKWLDEYDRQHATARHYVGGTPTTKPRRCAGCDALRWTSTVVRTRNSLRGDFPSPVLTGSGPGDPFTELQI